MKISLNQIDPKIGDFDNNLKKIKKGIDESFEKDANICVFPELSICGYPPMDLLEKPFSSEDVRRRLKRSVIIRKIKMAWL